MEEKTNLTKIILKIYRTSDCDVYDDNGEFADPRHFGAKLF